MPRPRRLSSLPSLRSRRMIPDLGYRQIHGYDEPLPEFPLLSHVSEAICSAQYQREIHSHAVLELCYVLSGHAERTVGAERHRVGPGDLYIIRPGEPHGARVDARDPYHFFAICFDHRRLPLRLPALAGGDVALAIEQADALEGEMRALDRRIIPGGQGAERILRRILLELDRVDADPRHRALTVLQVQALLVELLVFVARCSLDSREGARAPRVRVPARAEFQRLLDWLRGRLAAPPALAEMAARVGLSPAHFTVAFKREIGRTPIEHLTGMRIDEAARRLSGDPGSTVTAIALDLGFSSSQYFSQLFRRAKGCTPRQWRERHG